MAYLEEADDDTMGGLYQKATQILDTNHTVSDSESGSITFDEKSGISKQDQKDIIENINHIMQSSKIQVSPELFRIKAKKRGISFPFFVNLFGLVFLAFGVFVLWLLFQREETNIANPSRAVSITDQQIIDQLKQEAQQKNLEIQNIQSNLAKVNDDLNKLKENIDQEIASKEIELRDKLNAELEAERLKMVNAGASAEEVEARMQELQREQESLFAAEREKINAQAEEQRRQQEKALQDQRAVYFTQLESARNELRRTEEEYTQKVSEQEKAISEAEKRIQALSAQKEKFNLVNDQIIGYYRVIQNDIKAGEHAKARNGLKDLRGYLAQPAVASVPEIARRKDVELFVAESLESVIANAERAKDADVKADTTTSVAEAEVVTKIRDLVLKADEAYRAGDKTRADALYLQALELIPEINKSHANFINKITEIETFRKNQVAAFLDTAAGQYRNRQYNDALVSYGKALAFLPTDRDTTRVLGEIRNAGVELAGVTRRATDDEKRALEKLSAGNERLLKGAYDEAIARYLDLLRSYPATPQAGEAVNQLEKAIKLKDDSFSKQVTGRETTASGDLDSYKKEIEVLKKSVAEREKQLAALRGSTEELEKNRIEEENRRLAAENMAADYRKLQGDFGTYTRQEDSVIRRGSLEEMALGKSYLDSFLSSATVQSAFPGFLERIKRYDRAFELAGRNSALQDTIEILSMANSYGTKQQRINFLQKKLTEARGDELTTVLIRSLINLLSS